MEDNEDDEGRNVPNNDGGERFRQLLQNAESRVAQHGREVGKSGEEAKEVKSAKCPAKTHIKQCTCNFEVELEGNFLIFATATQLESFSSSLGRSCEHFGRRPFC